VAKLGDGSGAIFQDDYTNDLVAEWLVRIAHGEGLSIFAGHQHLLASSYTYVLMGLYAVFGHVPLLPKLVNCVLGALAVVIIYEIARRAFRPAVALVAAIGAAVIPSLVLWSVVTLKENLVLVVGLTGLWALQQLLDEPDPRRRTSLVVLLAAAMAWSLDLRSTTSLILLVLLPVVTIHRANRWQLAAAGAALVLVFTGLFVMRAQTTGRSPAGVV